jgi:hypothetical protein
MESAAKFISLHLISAHRLGWFYSLRPAPFAPFAPFAPLAPHAEQANPGQLDAHHNEVVV